MTTAHYENKKTKRKGKWREGRKKERKEGLDLQYCEGTV